MRPRFIHTLSMLLAPMIVLAESGVRGPSPPNWDRDLALAAAAQFQTRQEADRLYRRVLDIDYSDILTELEFLAARPDWPAPAREAALWQFVNGLRQLAPFSVDPDIIDFLRRHQAQTLVAHEEAAHTGIPLYPIRAAAHGLGHHWTREQAIIESTAILQKDPVRLVEKYAASSDVNVRAGIKASLSRAGESESQVVLEAAMKRLPHEPGLTGLAGRAALRLGDGQAIADIMRRGAGHEQVEIARRAARRLSAPQLGELLLETIEAAPAPVAAMLIGALASRTVDQRSVSLVLTNKLADPELGSAAALALVKWGSDDQRRLLMEKALNSDLVASRLRTAFTLAHSLQLQSLPE